MGGTQQRWTARQVLHQLHGAQKKGEGVPAYTRWVNRWLARYATAGAYRLGLGPNQVSLLSFTVSVVALTAHASQSTGSSGTVMRGASAGRCSCG